MVDYVSGNTPNANPYYDKIIPSLKLWESNDKLSQNELTLCHSTTIGSSAILQYLKWNNIHGILLESPYYYATYYQAKSLGFKVFRLPTFRNNDFQISISDVDKGIKEGAKAIWLTQPRISIGCNNNLEFIKHLLVTYPELTIIIDEAAEIQIPSKISQIINTYDNKRIIRLRSIAKGLGINGIRLALIIHHSRIKEQIEGSLWVFQGGLDIFSLKVASELLGDWNNFRLLAASSLKQTVNYHHKIGRAIRGTSISLTQIESGYTGSFIVDFTNWNGSFSEKRSYLLQYCKSKRIIIEISAGMGFALDENHEYVRLNYYMPYEQLLESAIILSGLPPRK